MEPMWSLSDNQYQLAHAKPACKIAFDSFCLSHVMFYFSVFIWVRSNYVNINRYIRSVMPQARINSTDKLLQDSSYDVHSYAKIVNQATLLTFTL